MSIRILGSDSTIAAMNHNFSSLVDGNASSDGISLCLRFGSLGSPRASSRSYLPTALRMLSYMLCRTHYATSLPVHRISLLVRSYHFSV